MSFIEKFDVGDAFTTSLRVLEKHVDDHYLILECRSLDEQTQSETAATEKVEQPLSHPPNADFGDRRRNYNEELIAQKSGYTPLRTAIVHPVDANSLIGAIESAEAGLITPVLVGPEAKIRAVADRENIDIGAYELVATEHSHAAAAAAVELVHKGRVEALMKGKIHTDELMEPIVAKTGGLRTGRRMSHVLVVDIPSYHKPLFITDAALNIHPSLTDKKDIVQNAIDLFRAIRSGTPKVAILSAVETVDENIPSTLDATALCKMADRGQITGGILDGPLAMDNAISRAAAEAKKIVSEVAGDADIIVAPNMETANILSKQLTYLFGIEAPGIVLGARVPIILTSRAASSEGLTRQASCALALLFSRRQSLVETREQK
ncbi:MAG: phosphate acetyltransferase [Cellvibrionaceae bacterium]|jgi:phosphate acetyltransferase